MITECITKGFATGWRQEQGIRRVGIPCRPVDRFDILCDKLPVFLLSLMLNSRTLMISDMLCLLQSFLAILKS
jgi:hypothetical protein